MATPVVAGTVALMLQANPDLTPNEVKAILQFTAQMYPGYDRLTEGAGFLNAKGAVDLATYLASPSDVSYPQAPEWSADRKSTRLNSSHRCISYAVFCLKKKNSLW